MPIWAPNKVIYFASLNPICFARKINFSPFGNFFILSSIFQKLYLRFIVVPISGLFNLKAEYSYIEKSIMEFPKGAKLIYLAKKNGFKKAKYITLFGEQMGILLLKK